jgi:hypothetical protein
VLGGPLYFYAQKEAGDMEWCVNPVVWLVIAGALIGSGVVLLGWSVVGLLRAAWGRDGA